MVQESTFSLLVSAWTKMLQEALLAKGLLFVFAIFIVFLCYDLWRFGWRKSFSHRMITGSLASVGIMVSNLLCIPVVYYAVGWLQSAYDQFGIPHLPESLWAAVPFWVAGIIAIVAHDLVDYWNHRAMHVSWIWPIHAIHHSDEDVNALTTFRVHFLEAIFMKGSYVVLLSWAGFSPEAASFGTALLLAHNAYVHANLDWDHGPFKLLIASPRFHRWHHANDPRAFGKNLANLVPAWDYIFGTYFDPHPCRSKMGADGVPHSDVVGLLLLPFKLWARTIARKLNDARKKPSAAGQLVEPAE